MIHLQLVHPLAGAGTGWQDNQMVLGEAATLAFSNVMTGVFDKGIKAAFFSEYHLLD